MLQNDVAPRAAPVPQLYWQDCGAACLLRAALAILGSGTRIRHDPYFEPAWTNAFGANVHDQPLLDSEAWETVIYQWTSSGTTPRPPHPDPDRWGVNLPSYIVDCAHHLGLHTRVTSNNLAVTTLMLRIRLSNEVGRLDARGMQNLWFKHSSNVLSGSDRELKVYITHPVYSGVMHYMMTSPGGLTFDPATARTYPSIEAAKSATHYHGAGISVIVSS